MPSGKLKGLQREEREETDIHTNMDLISKSPLEWKDSDFCWE